MLVAIALLTACTNVNSIKSLPELDSQGDEFTEQELELFDKSQNLHTDLKQKGLIYRDKEVNAYIKQIGDKLTAKYQFDKNLINIYLIKNATANAAALPNGDIYINTGLLAIVENEDQLASILAHEIGHVIHRHSLKSTIVRQDTIITANIVDILLAGTGLGYIPAAANLASFSREQESEADLYGIATLYKAGYDPEQAARAIDKFQSLPGMSSVEGSIYSTHPDNRQRAELLRSIARQKYSSEPRQASQSSQFEKVRQKLVELNVKITLANNKYSLALYLLDEAESYYNKAPLIEHYRGETYRLMAINPQRAAEDAAYVAGDSVSDEDILWHMKNVTNNLNTARAYYNNALAENAGLAITYRGLGVLEASAGNKKQALEYLTNYLELADRPRDRLYVKRLIKDLSKSE